MKRTLFFSVLLLTVVSFCYAQEKVKLPSYDDYIGAIGGKPAKGIEAAESIGISDDCKLSILPELSIIRQQYRLKQGKEHYGRNNKSYFGETYTLAVKVNSGMYLSGDVVEPWKYDDDYERMNASRNYTPDLFWSYQRSLTDSVYKAISLEFGKEQFLKPFNADKSLYKHQDAKDDFGLEEDCTPGEKKGVMIWAYSKTTAQDSAMVVDLRQNAMTVNAQADSTLLTMTLGEPERIIGGVFMVPKIEGRGVVRYQLAGVAVKTGKNKWALQLLVVEDNLTKSEAEAPENDKKKGSKKRKTKSEEVSELTAVAEEPTLIK